MGRCPSSLLFSVGNVNTGAVVPRFVMPMSNMEPSLCMLLRWHSCLSFSDIHVATGRSDGRDATRMKADCELANSCF